MTKKKKVGWMTTAPSTMRTANLNGRPASQPIRSSPKARYSIPATAPLLPCSCSHNGRPRPAPPVADADIEGRDGRSVGFGTIDETLSPAAARAQVRDGRGRDPFDQGQNGDDGDQEARQSGVFFFKQKTAYEIHR